MRTYKTEGIIIRRINFGEADRILTIFTKHYGKIKAIAKGVRRIKSRRAPHLELFNQTLLFLNKGRNLDIISEAQLINSFSNLRKDLKKVALAFKLCELIDQLTREGQSQKNVFNLFKACLNDLNLPAVVGHLNKEEGGGVVKNFEIELLQALGFLPKGKSLEKIEVECYIEKIIEKELKSKKFLENLVE